MKSAGAVRHQLKQMTFRRLKKLLDEKLREHPCNCRYNGELTLDAYDTTVRVCLYGAGDPSKWKGVPCDPTMDGLEQARECPWFEPIQTKEEIKEEFKTFLKEGNKGEIAYLYPEIMALKWVLDGDLLEEVDEEGEGSKAEDQPSEEEDGEEDEEPEPEAPEPDPPDPEPDPPDPDPELPEVEPELVSEDPEPAPEPPEAESDPELEPEPDPLVEKETTVSQSKPKSLWDKAIDWVFED